MAKPLFKEFFDSEKAGGFILLGSVIVSLCLANSGIGESYQNFWNITVAGHSLVHMVNEGLMTLFFLLIGLELEREIYVGELRRLRDALLPIFAGIGGMLVPAMLYYLITFNSPFASGIGIPMATDIAFAVGILALLGNRVPNIIKIFLIALAVIDDLGSMLVIAFFYTAEMNWIALGMALLIFILLLVLNKCNVLNLFPYIVGGIIMWFFMLNSGVHPTLTGVLLAFAVPFRKNREKIPSFQLQHYLHKPVAFLVLPLFALANTAIVFQPYWVETIVQPAGIGAFIGLLAGKPFGILLFCLLAVGLRICSKPKALTWKHITGIGFLAGIGFTMSIFITLLSFEDEILISGTKLAVLIASVLSGILGLIWLRLVLHKRTEEEIKKDHLLM